MKILRLYPSDLEEHPELAAKSRLLIPFFSSHSEARKNLLQGIVKKESYLLQEGKKKAFVRIQKQTDSWRIDNLLVPDPKRWGWSLLLQFLEKALRSRFVKNVCLNVQFAKENAVAQWLLRQGYQNEADGWHKKIAYHTALVLGGGGAHGAYQIGVWQALLEKKIAFFMIAGTSVGALNGGLILQGDLESAASMWQEIQTNQVLEVSFAEAQQRNLAVEIERLRNLAADTIKQKGISTQPLRRLLQSKVSARGLAQKTPALYVVATQLPSFKEVVIHTQDYSEEQAVEWLLASASFSPVMERQVIAGSEYVDGGFRNNIPVDVAIDKGATEAIVVDVQGPGAVKKVLRPPAFAQLTVASSWSMGNMLLFDNQRQTDNLALGYLEAKKALGDLTGSWYSFALEEDFSLLTKRFEAYMRKKIPAYEKSRPRFIKELRKFFTGRVPTEIYTQRLLEMWGRWLLIRPVKVYTSQELQKMIVTLQLQQTPAAELPLSAQEWLSRYWEQRFLFSGYNQAIRLWQANEGKEQWSSFGTAPVFMMLALFLQFIIEEQG